MIVEVHGGGYFAGSGDYLAYDGSVFVAKENVVVVTLNYRLGVLGFFGLGTEDAPGNNGLWDIVEALRWVHRHIKGLSEGERD